jgi:hypothetical protein
VTDSKLWKEIVNEFEIPPSCTSASFTLRNHYKKCLQMYEKTYFYGNQDDGFSNLTEQQYAAGVGGVLPPSGSGNYEYSHQNRDQTPVQQRRAPVSNQNTATLQSIKQFGGNIEINFPQNTAASVNVNSEF